MMLAVMPSVVVMLPEPIHTVITAPEVVTLITAVVVGVLTWITVNIKRSTERMRETVDQTHEQVTNTHTTNLRDDMDGVSGGIETLRRRCHEVALVVIAVWLPLSVGLALILGRVVRERDRH